jgi:hypothetical protein
MENSMQLIKARKTAAGTYQMAVHIDETKTIPDPSQPAPEDGQDDARPRVPDPRWVIEREYGEAPAGTDEQEHLAGIIKEIRLLSEDELALRLSVTPEPVEQVLAIEGQQL